MDAKFLGIIFLDSKYFARDSLAFEGEKLPLGRMCTFLKRIWGGNLTI